MMQLTPPSSTKQFYDDYWSRECYPDGSQISLEVREEITIHVTGATRCIDVGCGNGAAAGLWLSELAAEYIGLDISATAVAQARTLGIDARQIEDATALPLPDGSADLAICIEVLEHLVRPDHAVTEIMRVLAPGGVLVASVPNAVYWRCRTDLMLGRWHPRGDDLSVTEPWRDPHLRFFTARTLGGMLGRAGFSGVSVRPYGGGILRDLPLLRQFGSADNSAVYRRLRSRYPALLGAGLYCVGVKPDGC